MSDEFIPSCEAAGDLRRHRHSVGRGVIAGRDTAVAQEILMRFAPQDKV
jgi:hypothetical protein